MDYCPNLAYSPGNALYLTGVTGERNYFHRECPYPGTSYCEPEPAAFTFVYDGFISRFNMQGLILNMPSVTGPEQEAWLNFDPSTTTLNSQRSGKLLIHDASGRLVAIRQIAADRTVDMADLAQGTYAATLLDMHGAVRQTLKIQR